MKEEENDNIYIYSEEESLDNSAPNYSQSDGYVSDQEFTDEPKSIKEKRGMSVVGLLFKVMLNPVEGWKSLRRDKVSPERVQQDCFYPLLALLAISEFVELFYSSRVELSQVIVDAVISFMSLFFGYFCILIILKMVMPKYIAEEFNSSFGKVSILISLSSLSLFFMLMELFPMLWAVLIFLPLWTVYLICRGIRFFKFPEQHEIGYTGLLCLVIVGVPVLISWMLSSILSGQL